MALNRVLLQGRLTAAPERRVIGENTSVCSFRIAVDRDRKNKDTGEREADFFSVTAWRATADFVDQYFGKGDPIVIDGRLQYRAWTDEEGGRRSATDIIAENVYFGGPKNGAAGGSVASSSEADNELPF